MKQLFLAFAVAGLGTACADQSTQRLLAPPGSALRGTTVSATPAPPFDTTEYVVTPAGYYHRSCVYAIPQGAKKVRGGYIDGNASFQALPTCAQRWPEEIGQVR